MRHRSEIWKRFTDALGRDLSPEEKEEVDISLFLFRDPKSNTVILGTLQQANALQEQQDDMKDFPISHTVYTTHRHSAKSTAIDYSVQGTP